MVYNKNKRRGLYNKTTKSKIRFKGQGKHDQTIVENNQFYPYLKKFLEWGAIKGHAESTLQTRERGLCRFIIWCDERELQQPQNITREILESYQKHLHYYRKNNDEPLSYGTQNQLLTAVRLFFKWLAKTHQILYNPASELELPKQQRGLPKALLSVDEVKTILNAVDISSPFGIRDRSILELFYNTGIRRMELINLQVYDIDISRRTLHVRKGKGKKDRYLPVGDNTLSWVQNYTDDVRSILVKSQSEQTLFLTDYGEPLIKNRLTDMVKKYLYHAGIEKPGACHLFRHAMATHMLDNGADIRFIQAMLGHSLLSTTQIYTHVSVETLREVHNTTHPLNKLKNKNKDKK